MSLFFGLYGRARYRANQAITAQIPTLVDAVLDRLAAQKELAYEEDGEDDPFLFLTSMRDDALRSTHSVAERNRIWDRVKSVVEQNSNVRTGQREGKNGEVGRAWEWIGPSRAIEGNARRRRTRVSWGAGIADNDADVDRSAIHKKWEEPGSRPVY